MTSFTVFSDRLIHTPAVSFKLTASTMEGSCEVQIAVTNQIRCRLTGTCTPQISITPAAGWCELRPVTDVQTITLIAG
jgi:hypothetical protein